MQDLLKKQILKEDCIEKKLQEKNIKLKIF